MTTQKKASDLNLLKTDILYHLEMSQNVVSVRMGAEEFHKIANLALKQIEIETRPISADVEEAANQHAEQFGKCNCMHGCSCPEYLPKASFKSGHSHAMANRYAKCEACNGHGEIGGFVNMESGYQSDPCPLCSPQIIQAQQKEIARLNAEVEKHVELAKLLMARVDEVTVARDTAQNKNAAFNEALITAKKDLNFYAGDKARYALTAIDKVLGETK